jgi:hypothetical protein
MKYKIIRILVLFIILFSSFNIFSQDCNADSWYNTFVNRLGTELKECISLEDKKNDFSSILLQNKTLYIGYIGKSKKRLKINFNSIKKNQSVDYKYNVTGETTVGENKRSFEGYILLDNVCCYKDFSYGVDDWMEGKVKNQGIVKGKFYFSENSTYSATGFFDGILVLKWFIDNNGLLKYDDIESDRDSYANNEFIGTWTSYKTGKSSPVAWGQYRIPCAGDLDIGAAEFSPNPKYYKYGWADYKP